MQIGLLLSRSDVWSYEMHGQLVACSAVWYAINVSFPHFLLPKKEAEKRQELNRQGHGEFREITEGDFLGEVTGSEKVVCHFYHRKFYRCK